MKYRCDCIFGDGYRNASEVMSHEVFTLENTDILDTLSETILKDSPIRKDLEILSKELDIGDKIEEDHDSLYDLIENGYNDTSVGIPFFEKVLSEIEKVTGKKIKYCLWLCDTKEDVYHYDLNDGITDEDIDVYEESDIILSDIGSSGRLYGYETNPKPIEK